MQDLINKYVTVFRVSWFVSPVFIAYIVKQLRVRAKGQSDGQRGLVLFLWETTVVWQVLTEGSWRPWSTHVGEWGPSSERSEPKKAAVRRRWAWP